MRASIFTNISSGLKRYKHDLKSNYGINFIKLPDVDDTKNNTTATQLPEILFITSYPPRECGIATYSQDLLYAMKQKFGGSFSLKVCALESKECNYDYPEEVKYKLATQQENQFELLAQKINTDDVVSMVLLQHEFGLFGGDYGNYLLKFLKELKKPITITMHTVLPGPNENLKETVQQIALHVGDIIVMTNTSSDILQRDYGVSEKKISVIPHGTHLVAPSSVKADKKAKLQLSDRIVLSTFGLMNEGKSIETALDALPKIIAKFPNVLYLIIGKTHPEIYKKEGEKYRDFLYEKVNELQLHNNVKFVNKYLSLKELMDYLQRTDIYLFTAKDPNQAVSGTLAYAMACGCPVLSTPIPHAKELLDGAGFNFDFQNSEELSEAALKLLYEPKLMKEMSLNALHKINPTSWQNSAIAHINLLQKKIENKKEPLEYELPKISLKHIKRLTTEHGMIQFSEISQPNLNSGYTLDDNARALVAMVNHYKMFRKESDLELIKTYLYFIIFCQKHDGTFLNYVDKQGNFTDSNYDENLEDANGRAIWALGEFCSHTDLFSEDLMSKAHYTFNKALETIPFLHSPRAISFVIKGLHQYGVTHDNQDVKDIIVSLADNLVSKYVEVSDENWQWYEGYLTYANSVIPEALLCAAMATKNELYESIAKASFDFLLSVTFKDGLIKVVSNKGWYQKGIEANVYGEQPIDVAYTVLALSKFYKHFNNEDYFEKCKSAFNWFLGKNHLQQIVYNPKSGGCFDGLEENHINLNQGAESTVSYLMARLAFKDLVTYKIEKQVIDELLS